MSFMIPCARTPAGTPFNLASGRSSDYVQRFGSLPIPGFWARAKTTLEVGQWHCLPPSQ